MNIWKSTENTVEEALSLPKGTLIGNMDGLRFQDSVKPDHVIEAVAAIKLSEQIVIAGTQAKILVEAQARELAFTDFAAKLECY
jgi:hypothetical protein